MKIFITGGDGFLGSNLVRVLLDYGHELSVLVLPGRQTKTLDELSLKRVEGDLLNYDSLKKAAKDSEAIFHIAANTSLWPSRSDIVNKINIEGTQNIIRLAKDLNVYKLVHVGTANTFSFGTFENPGKENTEYNGWQYGLDYMDSKWKAHQLVMNAVKEGVPAVVVNPTFMFGAYDSLPSSGAMIIAVNAQKLPGYAPGGRNYICVKDAAIGIANALVKGRVGESYIIGNENLSYEQAFGKIATVIGVKAPKLRIPKWVLLLYGRINSIMAVITTKKPKVSFPMAKIACDEHYFTAAKSVRELDLPQTPIEVGIRESFDWLKSNDYFVD